MAGRAKRTTSSDGSDSAPPSLLVPRAQAEQRLKERLPIGSEIRNRQIGTEGELDTARADRDRWSQFNVELLTRIFDNPAEAERYRGSLPMIGFLNERLEGRVEGFREGMDDKLNRLTSVIERLELIPDPQDKATLPAARPEARPESQNVFVVHGHDEEAKQTVARFLEKLDLRVIILHEQANRGMTIIEKIERNAIGVGFVVVLLTPDDLGQLVGRDPSPRARQNVIFELGWFIAKLGREKVCALKKGEIEIPTDYPVVYVPMDEAGGWKHDLARELREAGIAFDYNKTL